MTRDYIYLKVDYKVKIIEEGLFFDLSSSK